MNPDTPHPSLAARALAYTLCSILATPAWSASTLIQEPPFTATEPAANVFLMLDDSASMGNHTLPIPTGIALTGTPGSVVTIQGEGADATGAWSLRSWAIHRDLDFAARAPALNPLWYNPAVLYRPWNKDGVPLPAASIGGEASGTHWGAFTARADAAQLTERDPRQAPVGTGYASVTAGAGRGLLGTEPAEPTTNLLRGRRVNLSSPAVDFRYYKLPFEFGPAKAGATTPPGNGHASIAWTAHNDRTSPLDLFSRPVLSQPSTSRSGCFGSVAACESGAPPAAATTTTAWTRQDCDGTVRTYTSDPGPLTCHRARCGSTGTWSAWSPTPVTLSCGWTWTDCAGVVRTSATNPGPISCGWRRADCAGTVQSFPSDPGSLTCYRTRPCGSGSWSAWSPTNPGALPACYQRQNCSGTNQWFSGTDPGPLSCSWTRQDCDGTAQTFTSNPGSLTCWQRTSCSGSNQIFTSNPGSLTCGFTRRDCPGTTQTFATDPGLLTCYSRQNCDGTTTGPTPTLLSSVTCSTAGELPITYNPTTFTRSSTADTRNATTFTRAASGGGTRLSSLYPRVDTRTVTPLAPATITPVAVAQQNATTSRASSPVTTSACPAPTTQMTCTTSPAADVPDPAALTPARYYVYSGTGDRGDAASYRVVQIDRTRPATYLYPVVDAVTGRAVTAAESQRTDCSANGRTQCTWVEEARNFANWWLYYRNRLFAAQAVASDAMSNLTSASQQQLRLGYGRINHFNGAIDPWRTEPLAPLGGLAAIDGFTNPGALVRGVRPFTVGSANRAAFFDWLHSLSWVGATPNREAIDAVGRYFAWGDDRGPWGATPGSADPTPQAACRRNFAFLTTDGEWTNVTAGQPLIGATGPLATPGGPTESDNVGGPTIVGHGANAGTTFTYAPASFPQFTGGTTQSGTLTDVTTYYWNHDLRPDLLNVVRPITDPLRPNPAYWQSMSTFIVGYGLSASMDLPAVRDAVRTGAPVSWPAVDLTSTTVSGGNRVNDSLRAALASRGNFYAARDTAELRTGILSTFTDIATRQGSAGGVAVTGAAVTGTSLAFFPSYTTGKWAGTLQAYSSTNLEALASGASVSPQWTASVPGPGVRTILTSTARTSASTFVPGGLSAQQLTDLTGPDFTAAEVVAYLRGDTSLELPLTGPPAGRKFRPRESALGDFVNSTPLYVKAPDFGYAAMPGPGTSYGTYVSTRRAGSVATVYIGGNAGMLHAFDAATGVERFAYVPRGVYPDLSRLVNPAYAHRYFVDGPVSGGDWHDGGAWRSVIVGSTGAGGASLFAIDTTNPTTVGTGQVMWDLTKADSPLIGHVLTRGVVARVRTGASSYRWVYLVGNGVESTDNRAALLVVDLQTGAVTPIAVGPTWSAAAGPEARNGMGGITVAYDAQRNVREIFAGDRQGHLWRFDFSSGIPTGAKGFDGSNSPLFTAVDGAGKRRPITAAPRLVPHPRGGLYAVFGTGKLYDVGDSANVDSQAIYGIWIDPNANATVSTAQVAAVSMASAADGTRSFALSGIDWGTYRGWRVALPGGERVISDPSSDLGTLTVASYLPAAAADPCDGGGTSYAYRFDYATGTVVGYPTTGVIGALTPLTSIAARTRTQSSADLVRITGGPSGGGGGGGPALPTQCRVYTTSIQGRPNVIAQNCPGFAPMRVWRQPLR
jgi:type IV pilus assembly protein PilY1